MNEFIVYIYKILVADEHIRTNTNMLFTSTTGRQTNLRLLAHLFFYIMTMSGKIEIIEII